jgi:hypothetical protein
MNKKEEYLKKVNDVKLQLVEDLNKLVDELIITGEVDYVELPNRIQIVSSMGESLDDTIFGIRKNEAIINTMFNPSTPPLMSLPVETLISILEQMLKYETSNEL